MSLHTPPHPGGIVKRQCLESPGLTVTRAAEGLGVTRQALSELINERTGISVDMAIRLSKGFGSTPETWLGMQTAWDLWQARDRGRRDCGGEVRGGASAGFRVVQADGVHLAKRAARRGRAWDRPSDNPVGACLIACVSSSLGASQHPDKHGRDGTFDATFRWASLQGHHRQEVRSRPAATA